MKKSSFSQHNNITSTRLHPLDQAPHMPPARGKGRSAITRFFSKKRVGAITVATPPDDSGNNTPASTDDDATRVRAMALKEAKKITRSGGIQVEALEAAKEAARRAYSSRSGSGRTLTRGDDGEDCDLVSSSSTSVARDEVALNKGCMPVSYIGGQSDIVSVVTDPGQQEIIVNKDSKIQNSHNASICDNVFQCLVSFVDALDESIGDKSLQLRELCCLGSVCGSTVTSSVCGGETRLLESCLGSGCGSTVKSSVCSGETGLLVRGIDYKRELCCKEDSLHISGSTPLFCALSRLSGSVTTKTAEEADDSVAGKNTAAVVVPGGGGRHRPHGTFVSATEQKSEDERRSIDATGGIDYDPNWRDTVADTVVTTPRAGNTNAGQCHMQQHQQRIDLPGEAYQPHPGAYPHSSIAQSHPFCRSMSRINEALLRHMPQGGIGKRSRSSHDEYYRNTVGNVDGGWQYPERAPNNAVLGEEQQHHHHSHVPVSGEPYSIVPKINLILSSDSMDEIDERIDRYIPANAGGVFRQGDRIYC
jgi:hypothetical protein